MAGFIILIVGLIALALWPQWWVSSILKRHGQPRNDFPGTGGEFARHILDEMKLTNVGVEETPLGDH